MRYINKLYLCKEQIKQQIMMTLEQAFDQLQELNLDHDTHIAVMKIVAAHGRGEYNRGFDRADELNKELNNI